MLPNCPKLRTFSDGDPAFGALWTPTVFSTRRQLESLLIIENPSSNSVSPLNRVSRGDLSLTEPDQRIQIPARLNSFATLEFLGLNEKRSEQIWQRWAFIDHDENDCFEDFGDFTRKYLRNLVEHEGCDTGTPGTDWRPALIEIGANDILADAIAGSSNDEHASIRLTKTAAEWVYKAIQWRWDWLLYVHEASKIRAGGGSHPPSNAGNASIDQHLSPFRTQNSEKQDVTEQIYDPRSNTTCAPQGQPLDVIPLWRASTRLDAEAMWSGPLRTGSFSIANQLEYSATDFSGPRSVHVWTPDLQAAQKWAAYAKHIAYPAELCLLRVKIPRRVVEGQRILTLRYPNEDWKLLVWYSRHRKDVRPKELSDTIQGSSLLIGDISTGMNKLESKNMRDGEEMDEFHVQSPESGQPMTQFVFGHVCGEDDFEVQMNRLEGATSVRCAEDPRRLLPPLGM